MWNQLATAEHYDALDLLLHPDFALLSQPICQSLLDDDSTFQCQELPPDVAAAVCYAGLSERREGFSTAEAIDSIRRGAAPRKTAEILCSEILGNTPYHRRELTAQSHEALRNYLLQQTDENDECSDEVLSAVFLPRQLAYYQFTRETNPQREASLRQTELQLQQRLASILQTAVDEAAR